MKFWDASAIVPLLITEVASPVVREVAAADPDMAVWWGTQVECVSALARFERSAASDAAAAAAANTGLQRLAERWYEIDPGEIVRETAVRFLRVHQLRAADALQLAAAFIASEHRPPALEVVTLDRRLAEAARKEGFALPVAGIG